jgi:hypothetical protein
MKRVAHIVALNRHDMRPPTIRCGTQGRVQVADAIGVRIVGIVRKHLEQRSAGNRRALDQGHTAIGIVEIDDMQTRARIEHQVWVRGILELLLKQARERPIAPRAVPLREVRRRGQGIGAVQRTLEQREFPLARGKHLTDRATDRLVTLRFQRSLETNDVLLQHESSHASSPRTPSDSNCRELQPTVAPISEASEMKSMGLAVGVKKPRYDR